MYITFFLRKRKEAYKTVAYVGPIEEIKDVNLRYSEAAMLKVKLTTARQFRYINDDRNTPTRYTLISTTPAGNRS